MNAPQTPRRVLIVLHQKRSSPGRIGRLLEEMGYALDIRRPPLGDDLPETLERHAGAAIFGGPMSANDPDDFIRKETDFIGVALRERKPFLGVCLGAQMPARHIGGSVHRHPEGRIEAGYYPLRPTERDLHKARLVGADWPERVYHWRREGVRLPRDATLLAQGEDFPKQAFSYEGCAIGVQFHPEVTHAMMCRWTTRAVERLQSPGAQPAQAHFEGRLLHDHAVDRWIRAFLPAWLARIDPDAPRPSSPVRPRGFTAR